MVVLCRSLGLALVLVGCGSSVRSGPPNERPVRTVQVSTRAEDDVPPLADEGVQERRDCTTVELSQRAQLAVLKSTTGGFRDLLWTAEERRGRVAEGGPAPVARRKVRYFWNGSRYAAER